MADHSKPTGPAVEAHYQFLLWLIPTIERFPKRALSHYQIEHVTNLLAC